MSFKDMKWEQTAPDYWELKATLADKPMNPDGTVPRGTLVIAKKQGEGQWRVSYDKGHIGWPGENADSLNSAARAALMKLHASNIKAPWINGSLFSPMLGQGVVAGSLGSPPSWDGPPPPPPPTPVNVEMLVPNPSGVTAGGRVTARTMSPQVTADIQRQVQELLDATNKEKRQPLREELSRALGHAKPVVGQAEPVVEEAQIERDVPSPQEEKVKQKMGYYETHFEYPKEKKMSSIERMVEAATHGAKVSVADEAANGVLQVAEALFGEAYPELMKTDAGKAVIKATTSLALHFAAEKYPGMVGGEQMAKGLQAATELVVEASARDLIQPQIARITPVVRQLAELGTSTLSAQLPKS